MARQLGLGKLRGLQQISDARGIFAMCAMSHRGSMQRLINPADPKAVAPAMLTQYKHDLTEAPGPVSTAVLLDPIYGSAQAIAGGAEFVVIPEIEPTPEQMANELSRAYMRGKAHALAKVPDR